MKPSVFAIAALSSLTFIAPLKADGSKVALGGYCPVAYHAAGKALYGHAKFASEYQGRVYHFINASAKEMFDKEPAKYTTTKYEAYCALGVALGKKLVTDPAQFRVVDGALYLFSSQGAKEAFDKDPKGTLAKAEANWSTLK